MNQELSRHETYVFPWLKTVQDIQDCALIPRNLLKKYGVKLVGCAAFAIFPPKEIPTKSQWDALVKAKMATFFYLEEDAVIEILKNKVGQIIPDIPSHEKNICEWCQGETYIIHKHHYPVRRRAAGRSTVNICPCCHAEFHHLSDNKVFKFTDEILDEFAQAIAHRQSVIDKMKEEG